MKNNQLKWILIFVFLVFVASGLFGRQYLNKKSEEINEPETRQGGTVQTGTIDCLPSVEKNGQSNLMCTFGLKTDSGKYYGLRNLNQDDLISGKLTTGVRIRVSGNLLTNPDSQIDIEGNIEIESLEII